MEALFGVGEERTAHHFPNTSAPGSFLLTRGIVQVLDPFGVFLFLCLSLLIFRALRWPSNQRSALKRHNLRLLLCNLQSATASFLWGVIMCWIQDVDPTTCEYAGKLGGSLYALQSFFVYCLLYQRVKAVGTSFQQNSRNGVRRVVFAWLLIAVKLGTASVPLLIVFGLFVFHGTLYFSEGFCVQQVHVGIASLFAILDTMLSCGYLLLFLMPAMDHIRMVSRSAISPGDKEGHKVNKTAVGPRKQGTADMREGVGSQQYRRSVVDATMQKQAARFKKLAGTNLLLSSVAIGSTMVTLTGVCVTSALASSYDTASAHWVNWQLYASSVDIFINSVCVLIMFKALWTTEGNQHHGSRGRYHA